MIRLLHMEGNRLSPRISPGVGGAGGADLQAIHDLFDFKNYVIKIMLSVQHNTATAFICTQI
jgi:hypothetical protein